jgi:ATP/maltotriose-dependent transcriptional regulator MalT
MLDAYDELNKSDFSSRTRSEQTLIKIRYLISLADIHYIKGDYKKAMQFGNEAVDLAEDRSNFTYETAP